jgi:hydrogenase nickel incorporation protein HypB
MCATCGCSDEPKARLIDLQTGETIVFEAVHAHRHRHHDQEKHDDAHGHGHEHHREHVHGHHHHHDHDHEHHHHHGDDHEHHHDHSHARVITLEQEVLAKNDKLAERVRGWLAGRGLLALNLVSSPGAGKTTVLERTISDLGGEIALSVIEGDQQTSNDAQRIQAAGCKVVQINTGTGCHLDAAMVARGLAQLDPPRDSVVMIENVGNLVCPALFDLGEQAKVVIISVTEGDDKPIKYPHMFRASQVMILNKIDLLPYVQFNVDKCIAYARQVNPRIQIIPVSATRGDYMEEWYRWLRGQLEVYRTQGQLI